MENRRTIYNQRHKIKNTHATYKPKEGELEEHVKTRAGLGNGRGLMTELEPAEYTKTPKTVLTEVCVVCAYPFAVPSVICPNCGNCQACGKFSADRFSNACIQCGNHVDGPRLDDDVPQVGAV